MVRLFVGTFLQAAERDQIAELPAQFPQLSQIINRKIRWVKPKKLHMTWLFLGEVEEALIGTINQKLEKCVADFADAVRSGRDARAPKSGTDARAPRSGTDARAPKSGTDARAPRSGPDARAPRSGPDARAQGSGPDAHNSASGPGDDGDEREAAFEIQFDELAFWPNKKGPRNIVLCASQPSANFTLLASTIRRELKPFCDSDKDEKFRPHVTLLRVDRHPIEPSLPENAAAATQFAEVVIDAASQVTPLQLNLDRIDLIRSHLGQAREEYESLSSFATPGS
jgi:2'-5' RNA ligase